jgi:hypothetical protein
MLKDRGKVKIYTDSGDFYCGYHYPPRPSSEPEKKKETSKKKTKARTMPTEAAISDISEVTKLSSETWHTSDEEGCYVS